MLLLGQRDDRQTDSLLLGPPLHCTHPVTTSQVKVLLQWQGTKGDCRPKLMSDLEENQVPLHLALKSPTGRLPAAPASKQNSESSETRMLR